MLARGAQMLGQLRVRLTDWLQSLYGQLALAVGCPDIVLDVVCVGPSALQVASPACAWRCVLTPSCCTRSGTWWELLWPL